MSRTDPASPRTPARIGRFFASPLLRRDVLGVRVGGHQLAYLALVVGLDLDHPALAVRLAVDELGRVLERRVDREHLARDRRIQIADALDALDRAEPLPL